MGGSFNVMLRKQERLRASAGLASTCSARGHRVDEVGNARWGVVAFVSLA